MHVPTHRQSCFTQYFSTFNASLRVAHATVKRSLNRSQEYLMLTKIRFLRMGACFASCIKVVCENALSKTWKVHSPSLPPMHSHSGTYGALLLGGLFASGYAQGLCRVFLDKYLSSAFFSIPRFSGFVALQSLLYFKLFPNDGASLKSLVCNVYTSLMDI